MNIVTQFLSFDKLIGQGLVKIVYFVGLIGIVLGGLASLVFSMTIGGIGGLFTGLIGAVIGGVLGICFWRFACELYLVLYRLGDDIAAIRAGGGSLTPPKS